jgi:hypothetical protein
MIFFLKSVSGPCQKKPQNACDFSFSAVGSLLLVSDRAPTTMSVVAYFSRSLIPLARPFLPLFGLKRLRQRQRS